MSIADELQLLANTKEQIRLAVGASKDVPFSTYVDLIDGNPAPQFTVDPSLIGIERQTAILANTKESLRVAIGLSKDVPFSQYASHIPKRSTVFDFVGNQYSKDQMPVNLSDISEFIRLSSATEWQDGNLVEVQNNIPRISNDGLLIEKSSTELIPNNSTISSNRSTWTATSKPDTQIGEVCEFVSDGSASLIRTEIPVYPNGTVSPSSGYYYRSILAKKTSADSFLALGAASSLVSIVVNLKNGSLEHKGNRVVESKISDINEYYLIETLSSEAGTAMKSFSLYASNNRGTTDTLAAPTTGHKVTVALPSFRDTADFPHSVIKTLGTPATRSPDILNIPLLPSQTPTGDWDAGVTYTVTDGIATFTGHGYIRNITVEE
ncbi:MAG: hypothetical protein GXZ10_13365 [Gammaproteobacteria bacterium]|nr:hypothetical protein [Gammaproteobacteria bacterium]